MESSSPAEAVATAAMALASDFVAAVQAVADAAGFETVLNALDWLTDDERGDWMESKVLSAAMTALTMSLASLDRPVENP